MRRPGRILCVLSLLAASPVAADPPTGRFAAGPYLLDVTATEAAVAFHLDRPAPAAVHVYDSARPVGTFRSAGPARHHVVRVTGLAPGRMYRYEVVCGGAGPRTPPNDRRYLIRSAVRPGEAFTFAVYGDCRPGQTGTDRHHRNVAERVAEAEPSLCLLLGDLVDDGADEALWRRFFAVERTVARRTALYAVMGDNGYARGAGLHSRYFPKLERGYYHFHTGGVHFFALRAWDTRGAQPRREIDADSPQARWLTRQLARKEVQQAPYRVVFMHDPVYICRGRSARVMRDVWAPIFSKGRVDVVFASWHMYERSRHDGVVYVLSGGAGAELVWMSRNPAFESHAEARRHHFCRVDVTAAAMRIRAIAADDGTVLDSITLPPRSGGGRGADRLRRTARRLGRKMLFRGGPEGAPPMPVTLFTRSCASCRRLTDTLLPRWASQHGVTLAVTAYDLGDRGAYDLLLAAGADFGRQDTEIPTIFAGTRTFGGVGEIEAGLPGLIAAFARSPRAWLDRAVVPFRRPRDTGALRASAFETLTVAVVFGAGLIDGINPCAFTTIIFLISYLSLVGSDRRRMLATGAAFVLGVFAAYILMGMFLFTAAAWLLAGRTAAAVVNGLILAALVVLAALSLVDVVRCLRGRPAESLLQLPAFLKGPLRDRIRRFARRPGTAAAAALVLGAVVAALELGCTGQVYLPVVAMIAEPAHRASAVGYLLIYNLAFVLPLLAVFLLATFGVTSQRMAAVFQRHVAWVKLALAALFATLAAIIVYNMGLLP